jgi:hypothetical protein
MNGGCLIVSFRPWRNNALISVERRPPAETRSDNSSLSRDLAPSVELLAIARVTPSRDRPLLTARRED